MTSKEGPVVVGHIEGTLSLRLADGDPMDIGTIRLPLVAAQVAPKGAGHYAFGIGVDLEAVKADIAAIFTRREGEDHD